MKTRQGFVSNSSSSSFILALDKPYDYDDMSETLFNGNTSIRSGWSWDNQWFNVDDLMKWINKEFTAADAKITTFEQFVEAYYIGWNEGPSLDSSKYQLPDDTNGWKRDRDLYNADVDAYKQKRCKELWATYEQAAKEGKLYVVEFADDDGAIGSELEHNTPWTNVFTGIRFSHH